MNLVALSVTLTSLYIYHVFHSVFRFLMPKSLRKKKDISRQKVLITGAGSGLGRQLALQFSELSTCLVLLDIDEESLRQTARLIVRSAGSRVLTYQCDVSDRRMVYAVAKRIKDDVGDIDILVNNAGIVSGKSLIDLPDEKIQKTMEVNSIAHFWICKSFLPSMMAKNKGHIVTVASIAGFTGLPKLTDYCASKHAAVAFAESLELELRSKNLDGIKVTVVCPSHINTELFEGMNIGFGGVATAEEVAKITIDGVLEEKELVIYPSLFHFLLFLKIISPRWLVVRFYEYTGGINAMEKFRGKAPPTQSSSRRALNPAQTESVVHKKREKQLGEI